MLVKKKYKHVFFDLDNTLWDFEKNSYNAMSIAFNHFEIGKQKIDFDLFFKVYSKINHSLWDDYRKKLVGKKDLVFRRFQETFKELEIKGIEPDSMNSFYLDEMPGQTNLNEGAIEILRYLSSKHIPLYIITNGFKEVQLKKLDSCGLTSFFVKTFISEVIKTPKPGIKIFEYAIKSANAKKAESIMIGDDWDVDILGAVRFGINAVYYNSEKNYSVIQKAGQTVYSISNLIDLKKII